MMSSTSMPLLPPGAATSSLRRWRGRSRGGIARHRVDRPHPHSQRRDIANRVARTVPPRPKAIQKEQITLVPSKAWKSRSKRQSILPYSCYTLLNEVLSKLSKKDPQQFFAYLVDGSVVTDYYDVIQEPMSFETMREKLARQQYQDFESFEYDVHLIINNCCRYNARNTVFYKAARALEEYWNKMRPKTYARFIALFEAAPVESVSPEADLTQERPNEAIATAQSRGTRRSRGSTLRGNTRGGFRSSKMPLTMDPSQTSQTAEEASGTAKVSAPTTSRVLSPPSDTFQSAADAQKFVNYSQDALSTLSSPPNGPTLSQLLATEGGREHVRRLLEFAQAPDSSRDDASTVKDSKGLTHSQKPSKPGASPYSTKFDERSVGFETLSLRKTNSTAAELYGAANMGGTVSPSQVSNPFNYAYQLFYSPSDLNVCPAIQNTITEYIKEPPPASVSMKYYNSIKSFVGEQNFKLLEQLYPQLWPLIEACKSTSFTPPSPFNDLRLFGIETPDFTTLHLNFSGEKNLLLGVGDSNVRTAMSLQKDTKHSKVMMHALEKLADKYIRMQSDSFKSKDTTNKRHIVANLSETLPQAVGGRSHFSAPSHSAVAHTDSLTGSEATFTLGAAPNHRNPAAKIAHRTAPHGNFQPLPLFNYSM